MQQISPIEAVAVKEYHQGEFIVREGDPCELFYAILEGEIQILQMDKPIRIVHDHDVFGLENFYRGRSGHPGSPAIAATRLTRWSSPSPV